MVPVIATGTSPRTGSAWLSAWQVYCSDIVTGNATPPGPGRSADESTSPPAAKVGGMQKTLASVPEPEPPVAMAPAGLPFSVMVCADPFPNAPEVRCRQVSQSAPLQPSWPTNCAQSVFVDFGFRSVNATLNARNPFLVPLPGVFRVSDLGGWTAAYRDIYQGVWVSQVLPQVSG